MATGQKSDLPFGSEFSPSQVNLPRLLDLADKHGGDQKALQDAIRAEYFAEHGGGSVKNQQTLAMNCRLGMRAYGLIDDMATLTEFGRVLYDIRSDEANLYDKLGTHILLNLKGMALVRCIQEMTIAGERVTLDALRHALEERGIHFPKGGKHPSMMRLWLEKAGVFAAGSWRINEARLRALIGADSDEFAALARFTPEQRAFLLALANCGVTAPQPANVIRDLAAATYGVRFPDKNLPQAILNALRDAGYINFTKTTSGRGGKPMEVTPTAKLRSDLVEPLLNQLKNQLDPKLIALLTKPLDDILTELDADDKYLAGLALEALAFKLMRILGMDYIATRLRNISATGGAEVDLIFHSSRLVYSRWQVQCKNTARVSLDDVAKEVGLTHFLKSTVIVMVSTGAIGEDARRYANKIMQDSNLCVVMIDRQDLEAIKENPASIADAFKREAHNAMTLKNIDL
ncbi:restriction endonuclease [Nitratidesulfovibrio sp. 1201_IL3209]|uniref:restriction endonuclease n=1 Tax=Nitratidesulfovibrio sp. 1201_IL3209 TaxID=3084053 RepID=UPI002FD8AC4E